MMRHILETKHVEEGFRCAVIVNDMATLNIDKSLIDQTALVQTDEVIAMQNGCFCCTLQSDLVEQIKSLAAKKMFNYMLIEASGVSEPSQIAPLFELCDDEHDHESEHKEGPQLGELARLDTCITVIDAAEFYSNLESMKEYEQGEQKGSIAELMMEQVEYSNIVVLNKQDLVDEAQQTDILDKITLLNPKARILKSTQSRVDMKDILNTNLFNLAEMEESFMHSAMNATAPEKEPEPEPDCCIESIEAGRAKCCAPKRNEKVNDTGKSQVIVGVVDSYDKLTRHEKRFGISSFIYRARRPFHPGLLYDFFLEPFFMMPDSEDEASISDAKLAKQQKEAATKGKNRGREMGELLRSKGFVWVATSHDVMGAMQQAGNNIRFSAEGPWMCNIRDMWEGQVSADSEEKIKKDMCNEKGEEYQFSDRRQELVFIGQGLKHEAIQNLLDQCLLNDDEMKMTPEEWKADMEDEDKLQLNLDDEEDEEEEGDEEYADVEWNGQ